MPDTPVKMLTICMHPSHEMPPQVAYTEAMKDICQQLPRIAAAAPLVRSGSALAHEVDPSTIGAAAAASATGPKDITRVWLRARFEVLPIYFAL